MGNVIFTPNTKDAADGQRVGIQNGLVTRAVTHVYLVNADAVEAGGSAGVIVATANNARQGDIIRFTSGTLSGYETSVLKLRDTNTFVVDPLPAAPSVADTFDILRFRTPTLDANGVQQVTMSQSGRSLVNSVRHEYGTTAVTTAAWVELIAATAGVVNLIQVFDSSGNLMELGVGAAAAESRIALVFPGGLPPTELAIPAGSRLSVRAVSANSNTAGTELNINLFS
jgi:hypothetical protein